MERSGNMERSVRRLVYAAVMGAILIISKYLMDGLPNIEPVSLLVMAYTLYDPKLARVSIAVFVLVQGLLYGFGLWWFAYLYIWYVLHFATLATRRFSSPLFNAMLSGLFGLAFGSLCSLPYFITGGAGAGLAFIASGLLFDLLHCAGNIVLALLLFKPLMRLFNYLKLRESQP